MEALASTKMLITDHVVLIRTNADQLAELSYLLATGQLSTRIAEILRLEQASTAL